MIIPVYIYIMQDEPTLYSVPGGRCVPPTPPSAQRPRFWSSYHPNCWRKYFPGHHACKTRSQKLFRCDPGVHLGGKKRRQSWRSDRMDELGQTSKSGRLRTEHCCWRRADLQQVNCVLSSEAQHAVTVHVAAARAVPVRRRRQKPLVHPDCSEDKPIWKQVQVQLRALPNYRAASTPFIHPCCFLVCPPGFRKNPPPKRGLAKTSNPRDFP